MKSVSKSSASSAGGRRGIRMFAGFSKGNSLLVLCADGGLKRKYHINEYLLPVGSLRGKIRLWMMVIRQR